MNLPCLETIPSNQSVPQHGSSIIEIVELLIEQVLPGPCPDAMTHQPNYVPSSPTLSPGINVPLCFLNSFFVCLFSKSRRRNGKEILHTWSRQESLSQDPGLMGLSLASFRGVALQAGRAAPAPGEPAQLVGIGSWTQSPRDSQPLTISNLLTLHLLNIRYTNLLQSLQMYSKS